MRFLQFVIWCWNCDEIIRHSNMMNVFFSVKIWFKISCQLVSYPLSVNSTVWPHGGIRYTDVDDQGVRVVVCSRTVNGAIGGVNPGTFWGGRLWGCHDVNIGDVILVFIHAEFHRQRCRACYLYTQLGSWTRQMKLKEMLPSRIKNLSTLNTKL